MTNNNVILNIKNKNVNNKDFKNNKIFTELINRQLYNIPHDKKLSLSDMRRICKYINSSIFHPTECCLWGGYITNNNNFNKGRYVNFYHNRKKVALHRLLYSNYVQNIDNAEYLKFTCKNKGICCNINHLQKLNYNKFFNTINDDAVSQNDLVDGICNDDDDNCKDKDNNYYTNNSKKKNTTDNNNSYIKVHERSNILVDFE